MSKQPPVVVVMQGLPASGKSTWARRYSEDTGAIRLNLDEIRLMMGFGQGSGRWSKVLEKVAFETQIQALKTAVDQGHGVVIDNTHVVKSMPDAYKAALSRKMVRFRVQSFIGVDWETCVQRDADREGQVPVGPEVITRLWANHKRAIAGGWALTDEWMNAPVGAAPIELAGIEPYVVVEGTQKAILVDLDGTLFKMNGRGPHEYHRVEEDLVDPTVHEVVKWAAAQGYAILLLSGRPAGVKGFDVRAATVRALAKGGVSYDELWMREAGDFRKDNIVKVEIFNREIRSNYDVLVSLDDRNQVVDVYRDGLGLACWQTAPGAF